MLILILIDVQNLQNDVFSFEKGLNCQYRSSSGFHPSTPIPWYYLENFDYLHKRVYFHKNNFNNFSISIYKEHWIIMIEEYVILKQNGPSFSLDKWAQLENWNFSKPNSLLFPKKVVTFNSKFHTSDEKDFRNIKTIFTWL